MKWTNIVLARNIILSIVHVRANANIIHNHTLSNDVFSVMLSPTDYPYDGLWDEMPSG